MEHTKILKILDAFKWVYGKLGVNYPIMRKILQVKLMMDERRTPTILINNNTNAEEGNMFAKSLLMYGIWGIIIMLFIFPPFPLFYKMNIIIGMILFLVMSVMISDYSSVLLDIKEKNILNPKPIDNRTINAAKTTHIIIYMFMIILACAAPTLIAGTIKYGVTFGIVFSLQLFLIAGLIMFFTSLLYFFILFFFDGEKLKDIINYFQIILAVAMILAYQLIGRIFVIFDFNISFTPAWWNYLLPSTWFAAQYTLFIEGNYASHYIIFSLAGLFIPLITMVIYYKVASPYFEGYLQKLNNNSGDTIRKYNIKKPSKFVKLLCPNKTQEVFYIFTKNMIKKERALKLKIYPNIAFAAVLPFLMFMRGLDAGSFPEFLSIIREGRNYLSMYMSTALLIASYPIISTSENNKAAWIYKTLPIKNLSAVYKGSIKCFIATIVLPVFLFVSLVFTLIYGIDIIGHIAIIFISSLITLLFIFSMIGKELPFSQDFQYVKHSSISSFFGTAFIIGISAAIHWIIASRGYNIIPYLILVSIFLIVLWIITFNKIEKSLKYN
ncbi:hypothetical protein [Alkaliphilus peptidifermentans]|uniref:ABC-2 type transport system permease protein n=1 Tax=Alkaliphilus peptidifermentans DSM 18978 TaxID=1120976 RepID=A0A1G5FF83_9FIRM|nr:hypothetical protein [Alkaliphilus peptidifermentans]SCY37906.1 hypothetical protein SAMN03080606_01399 [Alkaliphilus peptidifermentans DSM 18978]